MPKNIIIEDIIDTDSKDLTSTDKDINLEISMSDDSNTKNEMHDFNNDVNTNVLDNKLKIGLDVDLGDIINPQDQDKEKKETTIISTSKILTATIKKGTILYHHTRVKEVFDPIKINLNDNTCLSAFFSENKETAKERIGNCMEFPNKKGFIHIFKVIEPIDNIYILSQHDLSDWNNDIIEQKYCNGRNQDNDKYNGVGFYLLKKHIRKNQTLSESNIESKEYAICNPKRYLEYIGTVRCQGVRSFSQLYKITE